ncbi:MAG: ferritin-like domain-containing protein [Nitrososphaerota archaeon]
MAKDDLRDKLVTYLQDAYAMEDQIEEVLEKHEKEADGYPDIQALIHRHIEETRQHRQRMEERLNAYSEKPSGVKGAATSLMGNVLGMVSGGRTDTLAKNTRDEYTTEHLEIAAYGLLMATAQAYGDTTTIQACELNLRDEVRMASLLEQQFPRVALLSLQQDKIDVPQMLFQETQSTWRQTLDRIHQQVGSLSAGMMPPTGSETTPGGPQA